MKNTLRVKQALTNKFVPRCFFSSPFKLFILLFCFISEAQAAIITVTNTSDSGSGSLRQAILEANAGDSIEFAASTDGTAIVLSSELVVDKNLSFQGNGIDKTIISGNNATRVFTIQANATVAMSQLKVTQGYIAVNIYTAGSGFHNAGILTLTEVSITENKSEHHGGGIYNEGTLNISQSSISNNKTFSSGAGIYNAGTLTITQSIISLNKIDDESVINNYFGLGCYSCIGGGIANYGTLTISQSSITDNLSYFGGGIYGGSDGNVTITDTLISHNVSAYGGGILNASTLNISNSTISYNTASYYGGGLNGSGFFRIIQSKIFANAAVRNGGGIISSTSGGEIIQSTVTNNTVSAPSAEVGGILNGDGTLLIRNSIIANNDASNCKIVPDNPEIYPTPELVNAENSLIEGSLDCVNGINLNNLTDDPALDADLIPTFNSPVINQGNNSYAMGASLTTDFATHTRIYGGVVDMGAYEVQNAAPTATTVSFSNTLNVGQTLTASYTYADTENDSQASSLFQWYTASNDDCTADKTPLTNATHLSYALTSNELGKYICFAVTPKASMGIVTGQTVLVTSSSVVENIAQTINFSPVNSVTYGNAPLTLTATGGASGNPIVFASTTSSVCTVSGTTLTFTNAGTCTVTADQAGNSSYLAAEQVSKNITINKKHITAKADDKLLILHGYTRTLTYTGLVGTDTAADIDTPPTLTDGTIAISQDTYPILCDNTQSADNNYIIDQCTNGTLLLALRVISSDLSVTSPFDGGLHFGSSPTPTNGSSTPTPAVYKLTLKTDGDGTGTLGGTSAGEYTLVTRIQLTANPNANSTFQGWTPAQCAGNFYINADITCTATFALKTVFIPAPTDDYTLTLQTTGSGKGTIQGTSAGTYAAETLVQLIATAEIGSKFTGWTPSNCAYFALMSDTNCTANFENIPVPTLPSNTPPENYKTLSDIVTIEGDAGLTLNLADYFRDAEDSHLNYQVISQDSNNVTAQINNEALNLTFNQIGTSLIEITAFDSQQAQAKAAFLVTVASKPFITPQTEAAQCEPVENYEGVCNGKGAVLMVKKLTDEAVISYFIVDKTVENKGFMSDIAILSTGKISGGRVSGIIHNLGIIRDIEFVGKELSGYGKLGGYILNASPVAGKIHDVNFEPCAIAEGGYWGGVLTGDALNPVYLNNLTLAADTVLSSAILGEGVRITGSTKNWKNVQIAKTQNNNSYKWNGKISIGSTACFAALSDGFVIRPEFAHRGQNAELLSLVIDENNQHYSFARQWQMIHPQIAEIKVVEQHTLSSVFTLSSSALQALPSNTVSLFLGYKLATGEIIYSPMAVK